MNRYTNVKKVDIHFIYDLANGNRRVAVRFATVDETPVNSEMDFVRGISIDAAMIRETPAIFEHVHHVMSVSCGAYRLMATISNTYWDTLMS
ncbi:hypothetical protein TNCV_568431 [Trichonephila clavipes]|nr:hypothetical protein TNCV_568431 [Trichonephila clavipes]